VSDPVRKIWKEDGRYAFEAFQFLFESLDQSVRLTGRHAEEATRRHVSGQELLEGMRLHALKLYGPLAGHVWRAWGVRETIDWGRIVFLLVDAELLNRQDSDSIDDFVDGFDFGQAFASSYKPELPPDFGAQPGPDEG
jgi:uncharacterized repeat protein (TIGR04138 family)